MSAAPAQAREAPSPDAPGRPVRVAFLIDALSAAGTEMQLLATLRHLDRARVEPSLFLLRGEGEESRSLEPDGCPVARLGVGSLRSPSTAAKLAGFARTLRRGRFDVLQVQFPDSTYFGVLAGRLAGARVVRTRRNVGWWMTPGHRRMMRLCSRLAHATLANSEACRLSAIEGEGADPSTSEVVENGIDLDRFDVPHPPEGAPPRVGMVANLREVKSPEVLVEAAALLACRHPSATFAIAGEGDMRASLEARIEGAGLRGRFDLPGSLGDVPGFLSGLSAAVLCSRSEGMSNAILEYMAAARPIVATAVGGTPELVEDGVTGLLVPPGDPPALAGAIDRVLSDPALARRLGAAARAKAEARHGFAAKARELEAFYERLADGRGGRR